MIRKNVLILTTIISLSNFGYAENNKKEILYYPTFQDIKGIGNNEPYPGGTFEKNSFSLNGCKEYIKKEVNSTVENFKQIIKEDKENSFYYLHNGLIGESTINRNLYFCWPSDASNKEYDFFFKYGYISPSTKDKIFPLGERKYTDEPKPKMELIEK